VYTQTSTESVYIYACKQEEDRLTLFRVDIIVNWAMVMIIVVVVAVVVVVVRVARRKTAHRGRHRYGPSQRQCAAPGCCSAKRHEVKNVVTLPAPPIQLFLFPSPQNPQLNSYPSTRMN